MPETDSTLRSFGEELRLAREGLRRSIDEMASRTRINRRYIQAIETGDLASLPSGPYTSAFLREYARALNCPVPQELATISNSSQPDSKVSFRPAAVRERGTPPTQPSTTARPSRLPGSPTNDPESRSMGSGAVDQINAAFRATKEGARMANQAAKTAARSAARTTETVIRRVETGAKDAVDVITSKSLWEEADEVRKERRGLTDPNQAESRPQQPQVVRAQPDANFDLRDIRATLNGNSTSTPQSQTKSELEPTVPARSIAVAPTSDNFTSDPEEFAFEDLKEEAEPRNWWRNRSSQSHAPRTGILSTTNLVIAGVVVLFGCVLAYALNLNKKDNATADLTTLQSDIAREAPEKPAATGATSKSETPATAAAQSAVGQSDSLTFMVRAISPVWVSIAPDSRTPFRGELKAGETRKFTASQKFVVNLGNQKALEMTFNGQALSHLPTIQNSGVVVRDLVLTHDRVALGGNSVAFTSTPHLATKDVHPVAKPLATTDHTPKPFVSLHAAVPTKKTNAAKSTPTKASATTKSPAKLGTKNGSAGHTPNALKTPIKKAPTKLASKKLLPQKRVKNTIPSVEPLPATP